MIFMLAILCVGCREKNRTIHIFIPESYEGWVDMHFGVDSSENRMIQSNDDMYVIFLHGNLEKFTIKDKVYPGGPYDINYYFFSKDTLYEIWSAGESKMGRSNSGIVGEGSSGTNGDVQHFYVKLDMNKPTKKQDKIDP